MRAAHPWSVARFVVAMALVCGIAGAQEHTTSATPRFAVISIRPSTSEAEAQVIRTLPGGTLSATNVALPLLMRFAFAVPDFRIEGLPPWAKDRFDIVAKTEPEYTPRNWRLLVQSLLEDRFHLVTHIDSRESVLYALTAARPPNATALYAAVSRNCASASAACGVRLSQGGMEGRSATMEQVAFALAQILRRPVRDVTGLQGVYDFMVAFSPDSVDAGAPHSDTAPALVDALRESLGLKLDPGRGPVEFVVIDSVQRPDPN